MALYRGPTNAPNASLNCIATESHCKRALERNLSIRSESPRDGRRSSTAAQFAPTQTYTPDHDAPPETLWHQVGYRFAESVSVHHANKPENTDITDIDGSKGVPNVPDDDVRDAFDVPDDAVTRRDWILQQLANGVELKAPAVVEQFKCSVKTAQRSLTALKDEGKIEYVGAPRTGYYRLCQPAPSDP
jgi:hypothetical protein